MGPENKEAVVNFEVGEVVELKGWLFKIVLVDAFTNKMCMKRVSEREAFEIRMAAKNG